MQKLFTDPAAAARALAHTLSDVEILGLPAPQRGKVRQSYDLDAGRRLMVATDRLSAFDRPLTTIPLKGQVLTELSRHWFDLTRNICPNHLVAVPDPNVTVCRRLRMLPVEVVVRGYLAGNTDTSLLTLYRAGARRLYGHAFPDGMRDNGRLAAPVITPTTKGTAAPTTSRSALTMWRGSGWSTPPPGSAPASTPWRSSPSAKRGRASAA